MCTTQSYTSLRAKGENRDSCTMNTSIRYDEKMLFFFGKKKHDGAENITTILGQFSEPEKGTFYSKTANFYHKRHLTNFLKHLKKPPSNQRFRIESPYMGRNLHPFSIPVHLPQSDRNMTLSLMHFVL